MIYEKRIKVIENTIYAVLWIMIFTFPVILFYIRAYNIGESLEWSEVRNIWLQTLPFFVLFLLHNYVVFPAFFKKKKYPVYFILVFCMLVFFLVSEAIINSKLHPGRPSFFSKMAGPPPEMPINTIRDTSQTKSKDLPPEGFDHSRRPVEQRTDGKAETNEHRPNNLGPGGPGGSEGPGGPGNKEFRGPEGPGAPDGPSDIPFMNDFGQIILAFLLLGLNIGIKMYIRSIKRDRVMEELKQQNLEQELQYLRFQINPHFFMNTLNNIHALVDIDPEQAKSTIVELSRLMRYVLYDSSRSTIALTKEVDFLQHYVTLMRLRYTDKVKIDVDIPEDIPEVQVPPLLFVNFIENAFKHGISYESESFINVAMNIHDDILSFSCINSKHESNADKNSGIGLENIQKRLKLLYQDNYTFNINENIRTYEVLLKIPVNYDQVSGN